MPSYTFPSTANTFAKVGIKIVFAEIKNTNMTISIKGCAKKINRNTRSHCCGSLRIIFERYSEIKEICSKRK